MKPDQDRCPPHWFEAAWTGTENESTGAIYCKWCGDIRALAVPTIEPPIEERIPQKRRRRQ